MSHTTESKQRVEKIIEDIVNKENGKYKSTNALWDDIEYIKGSKVECPNIPGEGIVRVSSYTGQENGERETWIVFHTFGDTETLWRVLGMYDSWDMNEWDESIHAVKSAIKMVSYFERVDIK